MIRQIFSLNMNICGAIGVILNVILLFCIRYKSPKELSEMRYFLANMAISDILFAICLALTQWNVIFHNQYTFMQPLGPVKNYGMQMCLLFACLGNCTFLHSTFSMAFGFYFRQKKVCRLVTGSVLNRKSFLIVVTLNGFLAALIAFVPLFVSQDCDETILELLSQLGEDLDCESVIPMKIETGFARKNTTNQILSNQKAVVYFCWSMLMNGSISISYLIIAAYLWKMHKFLRNQKKGNMSPVTYAKLASFFKVNLSQAIFPIFTSLFPALLLLIGSFRLIHAADYVSYSMYASLAYLPIFDPIFPLYFIKTYRKAVTAKWKFVAGCCFHSQPQQVHPLTHIT